ncbi:GNAT family N-acetyltransferase [Pendulispora albinea]|uniref:GNAT family N-acetyltransferase n=1 Tax=Pendulispora albinea TaxID=2741071 RepID=A0ABZ2M960_9BACT
MTIEIRQLTADDSGDFVRPIHTAFGRPLSPEIIERLRALPELDLRFGAYDQGSIVGGAGAFTFGMTVPGGVSVETAGLTGVGVLPTHRRRGILTQLMRSIFEESHRRGQVLSALFCTEPAIYGRYGYGMASLGGDMELSTHRASFADPSLPDARVRFVTEEEGASLFPPIWDRVRRVTPGMLTRSEIWWRSRRLNDPDWVRAGRSPLARVLLELGGRPAGYALYRITTGTDRYLMTGSVDIREAIADSVPATRALWRYLLDLDLVQVAHMALMPMDHPLFFLLTEPRAMRLSIHDVIFVRLLDVPAALSQRHYEAGPPLVFEVTDAFCPWNAGRYLLADGIAKRTDQAPDLSLDVTALGSAYLGAFRFTQLALGGRVVEHTPGSLRNADIVFSADRAPWCPEIF